MRIINRLREKYWASIFIIYLRYLIGGAFVFSSIVKIEGNRFTADSGADFPINSAWHLFETLYQSGLYWSFLGWSQLIAGALLMTQRFATLGAVLFFPITINVFVITISYYFSGTPIITGLMLLANIALLLWDYQKLLPIVQYAPNKVAKPIEFNNVEANLLWTFMGIAMLLVTVVYVVFYDRNALPWFLFCVIVGIGGLIFHRRSKKVELN